MLKTNPSFGELYIQEVKVGGSNRLTPINEITWYAISLRKYVETVLTLASLHNR